MCWYWVLLLLLLGIVVIFAIVRLRELEREIRAEQSAATASPTSAAKPAAPEPGHKQATARPANDLQQSGTEESESLRMRLLRLVMQQPGIIQTEIYAHFAPQERRDIQNLLRELDQQKMLRREKRGSTYALYPEK
jgi:flagellar biosynthesis/type III secretory pathway M-ring protein FliF/YscJ